VGTTIKQIAQLAGVSIGTVDRALHGRRGIKKEVAYRVLQIAKSLGYEPNIAARALYNKRNPIKLGVVFHVLSNPFIEQMIAGINIAVEEVKHYGFSVIIKYSKDFDPVEQLRLINEMIDEGVQALVIVPLNDERIKKAINELHARNFPIILLLSDLAGTSKLAFVGCNAYKVGRITAGITGIISKGIGNVLYAASPLHIQGNFQRLEGFRSTAGERYPSLNVHVVEFDNNDITAHKQASSFLSKHRDIDSIILATGPLEGFMHAYYDQNFSPPAKIIALDLAKPVIQGIKKSAIIATVVQHPVNQGYRAIKAMTDFFIANIQPKQEDCTIDCNILIYESLF
jgi:LacI family transcriptional regulator